MSLAISFTPVLLFVYLIKMIVSIFSFVFLTKYLVSRFKFGYISVFMLSLCVFFFFYGIETTCLMIARLNDIFNLNNVSLITIGWIGWIVGQICSTIVYLIIGLLVINKRFDIYITHGLKEGDANGK